MDTLDTQPARIDGRDLPYLWPEAVMAAEATVGHLSRRLDLHPNLPGIVLRWPDGRLDIALRAEAQALCRTAAPSTRLSDPDVAGTFGPAAVLSGTTIQDLCLELSGLAAPGSTPVPAVLTGPDGVVSMVDPRGVFAAAARALDMQARRIERQGHEVQSLTQQLAAFDQAIRQSDAERREVRARQRSTEAALREVEESLLEVLEASPIGIMVLDANGQIMFWNSYLLEALALQGEDFAEGIGNNLYADPGERERLTERMNKEGSVRDVEVQMRRGDGRTAFALVSIQPIVFEGRNCLLTWVYDITGRKLAEQRLRQSEESLLNILEAAPLGVTILDPDDQVMFWNNRLLDMLGFQGELFAEMASRSFYRFEDDRQRLMDAFRAEGFIRDVEVELQAPEGHHAWGLVSMEHLIFENRPAILTWIYNITERKRAEQAMVNSEGRLRMVLDTSPTPIVISRLGDGAVLYANTRIAELLRTPLDEILAGEVYDFIMNPRRRIQFFELVHSEGRIADFDTEIINAEGDRIWVQISGVIIEYDGQPALFIAIYDVTERVEQELALAKAKEQAEEATRAKAAFLATMSHEIRTPMNGVMTMAELLKRTALDDDQEEMAGVIIDSARALLTIINDILDFSKIEAGRMELDRVGFSLLDLVEGVVDLLAHRAAEHGIMLYSSVDLAAPCRLCGDPVRLRQIVTNLVGNAIKFTQHGHVAVRLRMIPPPADLPVPVGPDEDTGAATPGIADAAGAVARPVQWFRGEIEDTGIGMTEEQMSRLFKPFSQAESSTARRFGGTGLGLSICRSLLDLMGGRVGVTSEHGVGSTFWFELPLEVLDANPVTPPVGLVGRRALVVSDRDDFVDALMTQLGSCAMPHRAAPVGDVAVDTLLAVADGDRSFDVIVLDSPNPDPESLVVHRPLIRAAGSRGVGVVALMPITGVTAYRAVQEQEGLSALVSMPIRGEALWRALSIALNLAVPDLEPTVPATPEAGFAAPSVEDAEAGGGLILVAEDNPTNRFVIEKIFERMGVALELAVDGRQALDRLDTRSYGMLITDCHMPVMDGYELARRVRWNELGTGRRIPIVALTADAMADTQSRCLDAGMDGYLTKPVDLGDMERTLAKWLPQVFELRRRKTVEEQPVEQDAASAAVAAPAAGSAAGSAAVATAGSGGPAGGPAGGDAPAGGEGAEPWAGILDLSYLLEIFGEIDESVVELLEEYRESLVDLSARLDAGFGGGDLGDALEAAHALKGASRNAGATVLGDICATIEAALKEDDPDTARGAYANLAAAVADVSRALDQVAASVET